MSETVFWLSMLILGRIIVAGVLYGINKVEVFQRFRIYKKNGSEEHTSKELKTLSWSLLLDSVLLAPAIYLGILSVSGQLSIIPFLIAIPVWVLVVEPIYYIYHRLLHKRWFMKEHHQEHHRAIIMQPATGFNFTVSERLTYSLLFFVPLFVVSYFGHLSYEFIVIYGVIFDICNGIGHLNVEIFPKWYRNNVVLRNLFYCPSFHSQHHSRFDYNFALFMPFWDWLFDSEHKDTWDIYDLAKNGNGPIDTRPLKRDQ